MAKTQATTDLAVQALALGVDILFEDALAVLQQLNWSYGYRPVTHAGGCIGDVLWDGGTHEKGTARIKFHSSSYIERLRFAIRVDTDEVQLRVGAACLFTSGESGTVRIKVGAAAAVTISFDDGDNNTMKTATVDVADTGTGRIVVTYEIKIDSGTPDLNQLTFYHVSSVEQTVAADLPDPSVFD